MIRRLAWGMVGIVLCVAGFACVALSIGLDRGAVGLDRAARRCAQLAGRCRDAQTTRNDGSLKETAR